MRQFADLYEKLDATTKTNAKIAAMEEYFRSVSPADAAWGLYFLTGRRPKRLLSSSLLRQWTLELTRIPEWLFDESYSAVGDTAECCALLLDSLPKRELAPDRPLAEWVEQRVLPLIGLDPLQQRERVTGWWMQIETKHVFILNKLLTGAFRVGVSQSLVAKALAKVSGLSGPEIAHRLMGEWQPTPEWFTALVSDQPTEAPISRPYPFFLASPIEAEVETLGDPSEWQAERKWDGIRAQLIRRSGETFLWSRGEDLITERFPEIAQAALNLPEGTVLDGEVLAYKGDGVLPFAALQKRIGRKNLTKSVLQEAPAILMLYDLLELGGEDLREKPMSERRERLEKLIDGKSSVFKISPVVEFSSWEQLTRERERSRDLGVEGIMLKRLSSPYQSGRRRGDWWKWKIDPFTIDAVLIYAQAGSGRRANLFTDYTFALWDGDHLVPVAKAYSGLDDQEIAKLDNWIRRNTAEKFGPVRSVKIEHVFELAFEGIALSTRHKSGVAVRFPRILRWRHDKKPADADTLENLKKMITSGETGVQPSALSPQPSVPGL